MPKLQSPSAFNMIRTHAFHSNPKTCVDNSFQKAKPIDSAKEARQALQEFDDVAARPRQAGVTVHFIDDRGERDTPDSVFPNNWFTTYAGGSIRCMLSGVHLAPRKATAFAPEGDLT